MNTSCPTSSTPTAPERGFLSSLQRLINTAGLVSVDLTDTIFASLPRRDGAPYEAVIPSRDETNPLPARPDHARMMSLRLP
jgi:hypothetical protein